MGSGSDGAEPDSVPKVPGKGQDLSDHLGDRPEGDPGANQAQPLRQLRGHWLPRTIRLGRSLRYQLTGRILLALVPFFGFSYFLANRLVSEFLTRNTEERLETEARLISHGIREWGEANRLSLAALSEAVSEDLRTLNIPRLQSFVDSLGSLYPHRHWAVFTAGTEPKLVAATDAIARNPAIRAKVETAALNQNPLQNAVQGNLTYSVHRFLDHRMSCLTIGQPVFSNRPASGTAGAPARKPIGAIVSCIPLQYLDNETGLDTVLRDSESVISGPKGAQAAVDKLGVNRPIDSSLMLVSKSGEVIYPTLPGDNEVSFRSDYSRGPWAPVFLHPKWPSGRQSTFDRVNVNGESYFVIINNADDTWSTLMVLNQRLVFAQKRKLLELLVALGLGALALTCVVIYLQCSRIIRPLRKAGSALQLISDGNFETQIDEHRDDEIGTLLNNVNHASRQLKIFLEEEKKGAVTRKQLETAREIQKDFLIKSIPEPRGLDIQAVSEPAYEIGADWYDCLMIDGTTYVVVADVCDKGIPSALYMSVFRSLLRYSLLENHESSDPERVLLETIKRVNDYMATNHQDSMMFATVFLAAVCSSLQRLIYVSAGHEPCVLQHQDDQDLLEPTGPAVGLFTDASYTAGNFPLEGGEYLVAYTDGLVDARSPEDQSWGRESLLSLMKTADSPGVTARGLLDSFLEAVSQHRRGADAFDDLTLMVVHVQDIAQGPGH